MKIFRTINSVKKYISGLKKQGNSIGFVPTMGYLHEGHLSLVRQARKDCDKVIVSIFVNPLQFGPKDDLKKYPCNIRQDINLLKKEKTDLLFFPSVGEMYKNPLTFIEVKDLSNCLCGKTRPGHFKGVATAVNKLFNIIQPDISYFGRKDSQQLAVIRKMVEDLNIPVKIKGMPVIREKSGLAMSSRNSYLSDKEKLDACVLYKALCLAKNEISRGERNSLTIKAKMRKLIEDVPSAKIDYIEIVDPDCLQSVNKISAIGGNKVLVALAVWIGKTRLIDNIIIDVKKN